MTGKKIGYIRVSTADQDPGRQLDGLDLNKRFIDYASGNLLSRPQLDLLLEYVREDDTVYVHSIDRLARNMRHLMDLMSTFKKKNVAVRFMKEHLEFNGEETAFSKAMLGFFGIMAELEREWILERQRYGISKAKAAGRYKGKQTKFTKEMREKITSEMATTRKSKNQIATDLGISRFTLYRYLARMQESPKEESV